MTTHGLYEDEDDDVARLQGNQIRYSKLRRIKYSIYIETGAAAAASGTRLKDPYRVITQYANPKLHTYNVGGEGDVFACSVNFTREFTLKYQH